SSKIVDSSSQLINRSCAHSRMNYVVVQLLSLVASLINQLADFVQLLPRDLLALQQVGDEAADVAAEYTVQQIDRGVTLILILLHQRQEHEGAAVDFMRDGAL